jgi:hypothetical protein
VKAGVIWVTPSASRAAIPAGDAVPVEDLCAILASSGVSTELFIEQFDTMLHRFTNALIACEEGSGAMEVQQNPCLLVAASCRRADDL